MPAEPQSHDFSATWTLRLRHLLPILFAASAIAGCNLFETTPRPQDSGSTHPDVAGAADTRQVDSDTTEDAGDQGRDSAQCTRETDDALCALNDAECGVLSTEDNCGELRTVRCGTCPANETCGLNEPAKCGCDPEAPQEFCARIGKDCGSVTASDNCGTTRTEDCGTCTDGDCAIVTENVCGCPCNVDGTCVPADTRNPDNGCEVCHPDTNPQGWTVRSGQTCDDRNACTEGDTCTTEGDCAGTPVDCGSLDGECQQGLCDPVSGCFQADLPDGTGCADDGDPCTLDACMAGACTHDMVSGVCTIEGTCYSDGDLNPSNSCRVCDSATSSDAWSQMPDGTNCPEVDGLACTTPSCVSGQCADEIDAGFCVISGTCYTSGESNPSNECQTCQPGVSKNSWSNLSDGSTCSNGTCGSGVCGGSTDPCSTPGPDECYIDGNCYQSGELNPENTCQDCDPSLSQTSWSFSGQTTCNPDASCASNGSCFWGFCFQEVDPGYCLIGGVCYTEGARNPDTTCQECDTSHSQLSWKTDDGLCFLDGACRTDGVVNPNKECEVCDASQRQTTWSIRSGYCRISGACYVTSDSDPNNACMECDPSTSQTSFSEASNSTVCSGTCTCNNGSCKINASCAP